MTAQRWCYALALLSLVLFEVFSALGEPATWLAWAVPVFTFIGVAIEYIYWEENNP